MARRLTSERSVGRKMSGFMRGGAGGEEGLGRAVEQGDGREQGMGIKSALILNYSRDKNPRPRRSVGDSATPSSLLRTF